MPARISLAGPQSDVQGRMATATAGTGTLTLGAASANATTFAGMPVPINDGDTLTYELVDIGVAPPGKEKGRGTYHAAGPTLSRDAVIWSTNGGAKLNLSGNAFVFVTADDSDVVLVSQARTLLTAATTFYIATNGSDANNGLSPSTPWATFAHASAVLGGQIDFGGQTVTLQAVAGHANFTSSFTVPGWVGGGALVFDGGGGSITITDLGNQFSATGHAINIPPGTILGGPFTYQNVTLTTGASSGDNLHHWGLGNAIQGTGVTHGACGGSHLHPAAGAQFTINGAYTVSGSAISHFQLGTGVINGDQFPSTVTFSGSPSFSLFVNVSSGAAFLEGLTLPSGGSYRSGSVNFNGIINRNGRGLPGNGTVSQSTGGQYL
jgi:hypothetical protein